MHQTTPKGLGNGKHTIAEEDAIKRLAKEREAEPSFFIIKRIGQTKKGKWVTKAEQVSKWEFEARKGQWTKFEIVDETTLREK